MSDYIPLEIQQDILKRLPVKSLIQCRSVSKTWKSIIDSHDFIVTHTIRYPQSHRLLVRYQNHPAANRSCISFADDESFPQERFEPMVPLSIERLRFETTILVGSSHGLLCWYGSQYHPRFTNASKTAVIWNPSIRKSVSISVPGVLGREYTTVLGFGVCPGNHDIKIVKTTCGTYSPAEDVLAYLEIPWQVEIYTLSSGFWRSSRGNVPRNSISVMWSQVVIDRFIYWLALDRLVRDNKFRTMELILSFDMITEEFREISLPDSLTTRQDPDLSISKLRGSVALIECIKNWVEQVCSVWEMKGHGVHTSFTKLYTIEMPVAFVKRVLRFRQSGTPVMSMYRRAPYNANRNDDPMSALAVYEPSCESVNYFGIYGVKDSFFVGSYMETLFLVNVPGSS